MQRLNFLVFALPFLFFSLPIAASALEPPQMCTATPASLKILDHTDSDQPQLIEEIILDETKDILLIIGDWQLQLTKLIETAQLSETPTPEPITGDILLNEALPNPVGSDDQEFIELFNADLETIPLDGWSIADASKSFALDGLEITAGQHLLLPRSLTGLALNNTVETIELIDPFGITLDSFSYDSSTEGQSFNRSDDGTWYKAEPSPDQINNEEVIEPTPPPAPPPSSTPPPASPPVSTEPENRLDPNLNLIRLNELMPNPIGSDEQEWIELHNPSEFRLNLVGLTVADKSKEYVFEDRFIEPHDYLLLPRADSGISLNNSKETVMLKVGERITDAFSYQSSQEGFSWALATGGTWQLSDDPTPESANAVVAAPVTEPHADTVSQTPPPNETTPPSDPTPDPAALNEPEATGNLTTDEDSVARPMTVTLAQWPKVADGDQVIVTGILSVAPGNFSTRKASLQDADLNNLEIYFHQAAWPSLKPGSTLAISGEKSVTKNGSRLLVRAASDIAIQTEADFIAPSISGADLSKALGAVVKIKGTLLEQSKYNLIMAADDTEISVNMKAAGILLPNLPEQGNVEVIGLIANTSQGLEIRPRSKEDVRVLESEVSAAAVLADTSGDTGGAEPADTDQTLSEAEVLAMSSKGSANSFNNLIFLILGGGLSLLAYFALFERETLVKQGKRLLAKMYDLFSLKDPIFTQIRGRIVKLTKTKKLDTDTNELLQSDHSVQSTD